MSYKGESKWMKEQEEAERLREEARAHLKRKGLAAHNQSQPEHKLARKDNTIALVEARKARKLANVPSGEEPLKPFTKRKEAAAKTKVESAAEGALPVAPELPYGWTFVDGSSVETPLFVHKSSGCTTVKLPKGSMMDYSDRRGLDIPAGWKTLKDNKSGRVYFWNTRSGVVQWLPPAK